jgi:rhamnose utilization protein RhaD (predicted bifunctional aldolase and dehydrogenase)
MERDEMGSVMQRTTRDDVPDGVAAEVTAMLDRANHLGTDPTVTNYGGGNSSCKAEVTHPATGEPVTLLYVKGSGGDLGTLRYPGLAVLELDRLRRLDEQYRGVAHEDEMVDLFPYCSFGPGGAAPSIDTPMHGLVEATHVDHLHPDSVIALAAAADGERLVRECYGERVRWIPWIRPGWELGRMIAEIVRTQPQAEGVRALRGAGAAAHPRGRGVHRAYGSAGALRRGTGRPPPAVRSGAPPPGRAARADPAGHRRH